MMKKLIKFITITLLFIAISTTGAYFSVACNLGAEPSEQAKQRYSSSDNFRATSGEFANIHQDVVDKMYERELKWGELFSGMLLDAEQNKPASKLPEMVPDFEQFLTDDGNSLKVIWFGHSSLYLNIEGTKVLVDPVFGGAAPFHFLVPRFQPSPVEVDSIPVPDVILISHDHYDHLEMDTIKYFADKNVTFVVPLGVSAHLSYWGVKAENIIEQDWWQEEQVSNINFIATPAQHFSGRGFSRNKTLWASWVISSKRHNIFFSGDTGYHDQFSTIGERYGPFDIAFMENGQYNKDWREIHLFPDEAVKAYHELKAQQYFPIHWGMFHLSLHKWDTPINAIYQLAEQHNINLVTPVIGEVLNLNEPSDKSEQTAHTKPWWQYLNKELSQKAE